MVGHTGDLAATIEALEVVDRCVGEVLETLREYRAHVFITADHGNAEHMVDPDGQANTAHTTNPVRLVYLEEGCVLREGAGLSDVAPTILNLLGVRVPSEMTGTDLCVGGAQD
jgi:2,3-bisphosphoglycerate-independent phosphoglycerate mutase